MADFEQFPVKDRTMVNSLVHEIMGAPMTSKKDTADEISGYAEQFARTAALFIPGKAGYVATALAYGLTEYRPNQSFLENSADVTLGMLRGVGSKFALTKIGGSTTLNAVEKGALLGASTHVADLTINRHTFLDENGQFNLDTGLARLDKGLRDPMPWLMGGLMFGTADVALRGVGSTFGKSLLANPRFAVPMTSASFGLMSGGMGETMQQLQNGKELDFGAIAKKALIQGGLDGLAGIPGGMMTKPIAFERPVQTELTAQPMRPNVVSELALREATDARLAAIPERSFAELQGLVGKPRDGVLSFQTTTDKSFKATTYGDYLRLLETQERPVRVYTDAKTGTEIVIPKDYDTRLAPVRSLRTQSGSADASAIPHELGLRTLPEDVAALLPQLPEPGLIKRVVISDRPNPLDPWLRRDNGGEFTTAAETRPNGEVWLYQRNRDAFLPGDVTHEWSHLFLQRNRPVRDAYGRAAALEKDGYYTSEHSRRSLDENFSAHLGEDLLGVSQEAFQEAARRAPIRFSVLADAIRPSIEGSATAGGASRDLYLSRLKFINDEIKPIAQQQLTEVTTQRPGTADARDAEALLRHLGMVQEAGGTKLNLAGQRFSQSSVRQTPNPETIKEIDASLSTADSASIATLIDVVPNATRVNLSRTAADNMVAEALSQRPSVRVLDASGTQFDDGAVRFLARMKGVESLDLRNTRISPTQIDLLRRALPNATILY